MRIARCRWSSPKSKSTTGPGVKKAVSMLPTRCTQQGTPASRAARSRPSWSLRAALLQMLVDLAAPQLMQRGDPRRHGEGVPREGARLVDVAGRSDPLHDLPASAEGTHRQSPADDLAQRRHVRRHPEAFLGTAVGQPEAGHHLVEDEHGTETSRDVAQPLQEARRRRHAAHVPGHRLHDHRGDLLPDLGEHPFDRRQVVVVGGQRVLSRTAASPRGCRAIRRWRPPSPHAPAASHRGRGSSPRT